MNKESAGGKEEEAERQGTCLPAIPACSALQKSVTSQVGSPALSGDAQVLLSLVEAGLVPSVTEWRRNTTVEHGIIRVPCKSRCFFLVPGKPHSLAKQALVAFPAVL